MVEFAVGVWNGVCMAMTFMILINAIGVDDDEL